MRKPLSVTDELLARTWGTGSALNQFFKRYDTTLAELGLESYKITDRRYGVRMLASTEGPPVEGDSDPDPAAQPMDFEDWASDVDVLLERESEDPATEEQLHALHDEGLTAHQAQQRIIEERANALISAHHEIEPDEIKGSVSPEPESESQTPLPIADETQQAEPTPQVTEPLVVAQTLADQAQAPHADSAPTPAVTLVHLQLPQSFTLEEAAPIAHRIVRKAGVELVAVDASTHQAVRTFSRADAANA